MTLSDGGIGKTQSFYVPHGEKQQWKEQLQIPHFENGPEPLKEVKNLFKDPLEQKLAEACLQARINFKGYVEKESNSKIGWDICFSSESLFKKSTIIASFAHFSIMTSFNSCSLNSKDITDILSKKNNEKHIYQILKIANRKFLVDLSIRELINGGLRLRKEEVEIFNALLKNGFVEFTEKVNLVWLDFLYSRREFEQKMTYFKDEWAIKKGLQDKYKIKEMKTSEEKQNVKTLETTKPYSKEFDNTNSNITLNKFNLRRNINIT